MKLAVGERVPFADGIMVLETTLRKWKIFFKELTTSFILWSVQSIELGTQSQPLTETKEKGVRGASGRTQL